MRVQIDLSFETDRLLHRKSLHDLASEVVNLFISSLSVFYYIWLLYIIDFFIYLVSVKPVSSPF